MGDVCLIKSGEPISKSEISNNRGEFPVINSGKDPLGFIDRFNTENDPLGITSRGAGVGSLTWNETPYFRGNLNYSATIRDASEYNSRFLFYWLSANQQVISGLCTFDGIPALNKGSLEKLLIPVIPLKKQHEIIDQLDGFSQLTEGISIGLPAELAARRKQYEYYRDKLLTFKELAA